MAYAINSKFIVVPVDCVNKQKYGCSALYPNAIVPSSQTMSNGFIIHMLHWQWESESMTQYKHQTKYCSFIYKVY